MTYNDAFRYTPIPETRRLFDPETGGYTSYTKELPQPLLGNQSQIDPLNQSIDGLGKRGKLNP